MGETRVVPNGGIGQSFVPDEYLAEGQDAYTLRNQQSPYPMDRWRNLKSYEIEALVKNGNRAENWDRILVAGEFDPDMVSNCEFHGLVRIGQLRDVCLEYHDLTVPAGITNSRIISCDIGDDVALHNVRHLAHYIIGDNCILLNIDEMHTSNYAKFGNGIIKVGESEDVRIWLDVMNEVGSRCVMPFDGMTPGDAYLWAKYRDDSELMKRLGEITQQQCDSRRGYYGLIGQQCVIKNCRIIKDLKVGPHCYIKGANKLKNLTINSSKDEPSQIGEGVELVNGIIGYGCKVFYGCKAVRFVMGDCSNLKYGARLIHSYLGDNSTVSCCEVLNDLIFPAHEQHHNNSFLTAALLKGQSNLAALATIGSNHNSRSNDGEVEAGRGFWPGLGVTLKHFCRFASFALLAKGSYPAELDIPLPFSLISNDEVNHRLQVMPAYWWMYNMYALARNAWKFHNRDKRKRKVQNIEFDALAPDTVEEIFSAMELLELWTGKASVRSEGKNADEVGCQQLRQTGRGLLTGPSEAVDGLDILGENMENTKRKTVILKAHKAYHAYRQMLTYYAVKNLMEHLQANPDATSRILVQELTAPRETQWTNIGGQLIPNRDVDKLREDIRSGVLNTWADIHQRFDDLWQRYTMDKQRHAMATLLEVTGSDTLTPELWRNALDDAAEAQQYICDQTYISRKKDYENPFRKITFASEAERLAVLGTAEDNSFVKQVQEETEEFKKRVEEIRSRG